MSRRIGRMGEGLSLSVSPWPGTTTKTRARPGRLTSAHEVLQLRTQAVQVELLCPGADYDWDSGTGHDQVTEVSRCMDCEWQRRGGHGLGGCCEWVRGRARRGAHCPAVASGDTAPRHKQSECGRATVHQRYGLTATDFQIDADGYITARNQTIPYLLAARALIPPVTTPSPRLPSARLPSSSAALCSPASFCTLSLASFVILCLTCLSASLFASRMRTSGGRSSNSASSVAE